MSQLQFIQITPEELKDLIIEGISTRINELTKDLQPQKKDELLTRQQTAEMLKVSEPTLYFWTKKGLLTSYGIGNRVYYKFSEVEKALIQINETKRAKHGQ